ncbi:MAG: hypothetical protein K2X27_21745, partial [Candidatus Obscuribacterales bacterium]|nr:hypothetical protein [Candidatus Obscuribacterales bacterium]
MSKFSPFSKTYELKTKLKVVECSRNLSQVCANDSAEHKPLVGWVGKESFELSQSAEGFSSPQTQGQIKADKDGSVVLIKSSISSKARTLLTTSACIILGAFGAIDNGPGPFANRPVELPAGHDREAFLERNGDIGEPID